MEWDWESAIGGGATTGLSTMNPYAAGAGFLIGGFAGGKKKKAEKKYMDQMNAIRNDPRKQALINKYQNKMEGKDLLTPLLYKQRADESVKRLGSALSGQRGLSRGLSARNMSNAYANAGVQEAENTAMLEQQERDSAAINLNALLSGQQSMDANIAKAQYGIDAERAMMPSKLLGTAIQGYGMYKDRQMAETMMQEQMRNSQFDREMRSSGAQSGASNIYNKQAMGDLLMQKHEAMMARYRQKSPTGGVIKGLGQHPPSMGMGY